MLLFQFRASPSSPPTLKDVCTRYALQMGEVDNQYGVVATDSHEGLYVVLVDPAVTERLRQRLTDLGLGNDAAVGVFSNPHVEPFVSDMETSGEHGTGHPWCC